MIKLWRVVAPTQTEIIIYLFVSAIILVAINTTAITSLFVDPTAFSLGWSVFREKFDAFLRLIDSFSVTSTFALAFFWALFGTAVYICGFTLYELFVETKHDLGEAAIMHHPTYLKHRSATVTFLARSAVRIVTCILIALYLFLLLGLLLPLCSQLVYDISYVIRDPITIINPVAGVMLFALSLHMLTILARLLFLRDRLGGRIEPTD